MIILVKLELTLLIIETGHVHVVFSLTRSPWLTLIVLFSLTALYEPSSSQKCSLWVHSLFLLTFLEVNTSFMIALVFFLFTTGYS